MIVFAFSIRFIAGLIVGGAAVWLAKPQLATSGAFIAKTVKGWLAKKT